MPDSLTSPLVPKGFPSPESTTDLFSGQSVQADLPVNPPKTPIITKVALRNLTLFAGVSLATLAILFGVSGGFGKFSLSVMGPGYFYGAVGGAAGLSALLAGYVAAKHINTDYDIAANFKSEPTIRGKKFDATGHSRLGKLALVGGLALLVIVSLGAAAAAGHDIQGFSQAVKALGTGGFVPVAIVVGGVGIYAIYRGCRHAKYYPIAEAEERFGTEMQRREDTRGGKIYKEMSALISGIPELQREPFVNRLTEVVIARMAKNFLVNMSSIEGLRVGECIVALMNANRLSMDAVITGMLEATFLKDDPGLAAQAAADILVEMERNATAGTIEAIANIRTALNSYLGENHLPVPNSLFT